MQLTIKCCACGAEMATQECDYVFWVSGRDTERPTERDVYYGGHCAKCQDELWPKNG